MSDTFVPVYCTSKFSAKLLNAFFEQANRATEKSCYEVPVGFLMSSTELPNNLGEEEYGTTAPISSDALKSNPFQGKTHAEVVQWALENIDLECGLLKTDLVILDDRSDKDETCQLLSLKEDWDESPGLEQDPEKWISVRSDFESSILTIMTKASGVGGDEHFETSLKGGFEGVLRISEKRAEEARAYPVEQSEQ